MRSLIGRAIKRFLTIQVMVFTSVFSFLLALTLIGGLTAAVSDTNTSRDVLDYTVVAGDESGKATLLSIPVKGIILGEKTRSDAFFEAFSDGLVYGYEVKQQLYLASKDISLDGVILEIDSPGGTIFGSQAIADGVAQYKEATGKPVYAFVAGMSASGGYWVASATDQIIADAGTAIGGIGVLTGPFKEYSQVTSEGGGLLEPSIVTQDGIKTTYITAGEHKDLGNPFRAMTEQERQTLQISVNDSYQDFVSFVAQQRNMQQDQVTDSIRALIYGEKQALVNGLIDAVGSKQDAYGLLAKATGAESYKIVQSHEIGGMWNALFGAASNIAAIFSQSSNKHLSLSLCETTVVLAYHGNPYRVCGL